MVFNLNKKKEKVFKPNNSYKITLPNGGVIDCRPEWFKRSFFGGIKPIKLKEPTLTNSFIIHEVVELDGRYYARRHFKSGVVTDGLIADQNGLNVLSLVV